MLKHFKHRNKVIAATLLCCIVAGVTMTSSKDKGAGAASSGGEIDPANPPLALKVTTRLLRPGEGPNGETMQLKVAYDRNTISTPTVTVYTSSDVKVTLADDGRTGGDEVAGDGVFAAFITEDVTAFREGMVAFDRTLQENGNNLLVFDKRAGSIQKRDRPFFDDATFGRNEEIEISKDLFNLQPYTEAATIKASGQGFQGRDYAGGSITSKFSGPSSISKGYGPPPLPFPIKKHHSLLITSLAVVEDPVRTFNPCTNVGNPNGAWTFKTLMRGLAGGGAAPATRLFVKNWLNKWMVNQVVNGETVQNRSVRMLSQVIKPWIDKARGSVLPTVTAANWQALWDGLTEDALLNVSPFKLTAIVNRQDLRTNPGYSGGTSNSGETRFIYSVIKNTTTANCRDSVGTGGFDGMTCIFEYGNVQTNCNSIKAFANLWYQLSRPGLVLGSATYLSELQTITNSVTLAGAAPAKGNGSALNQLRSNEIALTNSANTLNDRSPRWQFREFKIPAVLGVQQIAQVPTAQEPAGKFNAAGNVPFVAAFTPLPADVATMANWVNTNSVAIQNGTYVVPTVIGSTDFLAGKVNYPSTSALVSPGFWDGNAASPIIDDKTRENFSVGTCTGCHGGETQTDFTHVNYVGNGVSMNYTTTLNFIFSGLQHKTFISPFLTGVDVIPTAPNVFVFGDDSTSAIEDATDATLTGLFYARDPAGRVYPGTGVVRKWGFNDLERRAQDMTNILNSNCFRVLPISFASAVFFRPLNMVH